MDRSRFEGELPSALPRNIRKLTFTVRATFPPAATPPPLTTVRARR